MKSRKHPPQGHPFGLLVRKVAKLEREVALKAISSFISGQKLNSNQIAFVDKPQKFIKLFDPDKQKNLVKIINEIKDNATKIIS